MHTSLELLIRIAVLTDGKSRFQKQEGLMGKRYPSEHCYLEYSSISLAYKCSLFLAVIHCGAHDKKIMYFLPSPSEKDFGGRGVRWICFTAESVLKRNFHLPFELFWPWSTRRSVCAAPRLSIFIPWKITFAVSSTFPGAPLVAALAIILPIRQKQNKGCHCAAIAHLHPTQLPSLLLFPSCLTLLSDNWI